MSEGVNQSVLDLSSTITDFEWFMAQLIGLEVEKKIVSSFQEWSMTPTEFKGPTATVRVVFDERKERLDGPDDIQFIFLDEDGVNRFTVYPYYLADMLDILGDATTKKLMAMRIKHTVWGEGPDHMSRLLAAMNHVTASGLDKRQKPDISDVGASKDIADITADDLGAYLASLGCHKKPISTSNDYYQHPDHNHDITVNRGEAGIRLIRNAAWSFNEAALPFAMNILKHLNSKG